MNSNTVFACIGTSQSKLALFLSQLNIQNAVLYFDRGEKDINTISLSEDFYTSTGRTGIFNIYYNRNEDIDKLQTPLIAFCQRYGIRNCINTIQSNRNDIKLIARNDNLSEMPIIKIKGTSAIYECQMLNSLYGNNVNVPVYFLPVVSPNMNITIMSKL